MTIEEMKTRTALYDFLDLTQATLNSQFVVAFQPTDKGLPMSQIEENLTKLINSINQFKRYLDTGAIN